VRDFPWLSTILGDVHVNPDACSDQLHLEGARTVEREIECIGIFALFAPPLETGHPIAVDHDVGVGRIRVKSLADQDSGLAVLVPVTEESHRGRDRKVAGYLSPDVLELILLGPDVYSGAGYPILPVGKLAGPFNRRTTDVA
jgi:hypothetical protein